MPRIPEQVVAMLATAKIGTVHSVVYGRFSVESLAERIMDAESTVLITADGDWLRGKIVAPTAIRGLMRFGDAWAKRHDLSSLRLLGSVGEPINPEAWRWYYTVIGHERCPIMGTWWQTETGGFMITPIPVVPLKPGSATRPFFGIEVDVVDESGKSAAPGEEGYLVVKKPWPGMLRTVNLDPERYASQYWGKFGTM